jgi:hypothetical protein
MRNRYLDSKWVTNGIVSGLVAGIILALYLILTGMTEPFGNYIDLPTKLGGMIVHFIGSIIIGLIFAFVLSWLIISWESAIFFGLLYGLVIWVIGPLTLGALATGESLFSKWHQTSVQANLPLLLGLLLYGLVLGLVYCFLKKGKLHELKK